MIIIITIIMIIIRLFRRTKLQPGWEMSNERSSKLDDGWLFPE